MANGVLEYNEKQLVLQAKMGIRGKYKIYPERIYLNLTNRCNLYCVMCSHTSKDYKNKTYDDALPFSTTLEDIKRLFEGGNFPDELRQKPIEFCSFSGETFLNVNIYEIFRYIKEELPCSRIAVTSNGTIPPVRDDIVKYIDKLAFSVDGSTKETYEAIRTPASFEKAKAAMARWYEAKLKHESEISFGFNVCLSGLNIRELPGIVRLAHELCRVENVYCQPLITYDKTKELKKYELNNIDVREARKYLEEAVNAARDLGVRLDIQQSIWDLLDDSKITENNKLAVDFTKNRYCQNLRSNSLVLTHDSKLRYLCSFMHMDQQRELMNKYNIPAGGNMMDLLNSPQMWKLRKDFIEGKCLGYCGKCLYGQSGYNQLSTSKIPEEVKDEGFLAGLLSRFKK